MSTEDHIRNAITKAGSQAKLAAKIGCSQPAIHKLLSGNVSAEMALKLKRVTGIPLHILRPDLWKPPSKAGTPRAHIRDAHDAHTHEETNK